MKIKLTLTLLALAAVLGLFHSWPLCIGLFLAGLGILVLAPSRKLPGNRVRIHRLKLRMRMHPGRGQASAFELFLRWGRLAAFRESARSRPSLGTWYRLRHADEHSVLVGRAHYGIQLRIPVQEHAAVFGPPRESKSAWLATVIANYQGSVVSSSSKPDQFLLTSGLRAQRGSRIHTFNPQGLGGVPSSFAWNPLEGCEDEATAIRRAEGFANSVSTKDVEGGSFWTSTAALYLRAMFHAAALAGSDLRIVTAWVFNKGQSEQAEKILTAAGKHQMARQLAGYRGPADKANAAVTMILAGALEFATDPALAACVLPGDGGRFDVDQFLLNGESLFLIAKGNAGASVLAPLFATMASEIHFRALQLGSQMPGNRLDPPCLFALDEVTQTVPVPLPAWLADSGGQGVQVIPVFHGIAQAEERWNKTGARIVLDTCSSKVFLPGVSDPDTLDMASKLCGTVAMREAGADKAIQVDVLTPAMIRQLPPRRALTVRRANSPVIVKLGSIWNTPAYRKARRAGTAVAAVTAAPQAAVSALDMPLDVPAEAAVGELTEDVLGMLLSDANREPERVPADNPWGV